MDFGRAFSYPMQDTDKWKKVIIMGLIFLIPILGQLVLAGWMIDVVKKVIRHEDVTLPELDFGGQLSKGFGAFVIGLVYAIPMIILGIIQGVVSAGGSSMMGNGSDNTTTAVGAVVTIVSVCFGLIYLVYGIILGFLLPMAYGRYADRGKISDGLKFGDVFGLVKKAPGDIFIAMLGSWVASLVGSLGSIACGVGILLTLPYSFAVIGHFYGQAYNVASSR
jgi:hypothetical protein